MRITVTCIMKNKMKSFASFLLVLMFVFMKQVSSQKVLNSQIRKDLTLDPGSVGPDIVDATIQKIESVAKLKNDFGFLKRIALVESNFGETLSVTNSIGGIWQISETIASALTSGSLPESTQDLINDFSKAFGKDAVNFGNPSFSQPLRSAIAARIFIEMRLTAGQEYPGTIDDQAIWWAFNYKNPNGDPNDFSSVVREFEEIQCTVSTMDLWFLIDGSGSIGSENFELCLDFVNQTASQFVIDPDRIRTGLMIYSSVTIIRSLLNQHQSVEEFSNVALSTPYPGGGTATGAAMTAVHQIGFAEENGARPKSQGVPRVLLVLTDGQSGDSVVEPAVALHNDGVSVFGVGIGTGFNRDEINQIAKDPDSKYAFALEQFQLLFSILLKAVADQACSVIAEIQEGTNASFVYQPGSVSYSQVELPENGSLELTFEVHDTTSRGVVYVSVTYTNPGPALHDAMFEVPIGITVVFYNVESESENANNQRRKRQADDGSRPTHLYMAFETQGTEPINVEFMAAKRDEIVVPSPTPTPEIIQTTSGFQVLKGIEAFPLLVLSLLVAWNLDVFG